MSLTYICAICGEPGNVYAVEDILFVDPCENHCHTADEHTAVAEFEQDIEDEKNGIFRHDEEWCKENNYDYKD